MHADYEPIGIGFHSFEEALDTIDPENAPIGHSFKVCGNIYKLIDEAGELGFEE